MMFFVFLIFVALAFADSKDSCKGVNAQVNSEFTDHDVNEYIDIGTKDASRLNVLQRYRNYNHKNWKVKETGTVVQTMELEYHPMDVVLRDTIVDQKGMDKFDGAFTQHGVQLSNFRPVDVKVDFQPGYTDNVGVLALGSLDEYVDGMFGLHFAALKETDRNLDFGRENIFKNYVPVFDYFYDFSETQYTYFRDGKKGDQYVPTARDQSIFNSYSIAPQVKTYLYEEKEQNAVNMLTMIWSQENLKFYNYEWSFVMDETLRGHKTPEKFLKQKIDPIMLIPKVQDTVYNANEEYASYFYYNEDTSFLYVLVEMNQDQARAFDTKYAGIVQEKPAFDQFFNKSGPYPFLIRLHKGESAFTLDSYQNVMNGFVDEATGLPTSDFPDRAYGTGLSVRDGRVLVTSAAYQYRTLNGDQQDTSDYDAYLSLYVDRHSKMYTSTVLNKCVKYDNDKFPGIDKFNHLTFFPAAASWTVDGGVDKVVVGGFVYSYDKPWNKKGRIYNLDVSDPDKMKIYLKTPLGFSDRKANELTGIVLSDQYVKKSNEKNANQYRMWLKLKIDTPRDNKKNHKSNKADIWRVDCTVPNKALEIFAAVLFFLFVFIAAVMCIFATCVFSLKAVIKCGLKIAKKLKGTSDALEDEEKEKEEETKNLLNEEEGEGERETVINSDEDAPTML